MLWEVSVPRPRACSLQLRPRRARPTSRRLPRDFPRPGFGGMKMISVSRPRPRRRPASDSKASELITTSRSRARDVVPAALGDLSDCRRAVSGSCSMSPSLGSRRRMISAALSVVAAIRRVLARRLGQPAYLLGHDGEALSRLAGMGGLDGRVHREQARLVGDALEELHHLEYRAGPLGRWRRWPRPSRSSRPPLPRGREGEALGLGELRARRASRWNRGWTLICLIDAEDWRHGRRLLLDEADELPHRGLDAGEALLGPGLSPRGGGRSWRRSSASSPPPRPWWPKAPANGKRGPPRLRLPPRSPA